ncbi:MAG TPA: BON domain-containing protein [Longimicrobiaceae bacterium]
MHRYDRGWNQGYHYPSASVPYDRLYRRGPASRRPYRRGWAPYDEELYQRWGRPRGFERYGGYPGRGRWEQQGARPFRYPDSFTSRRGAYDELDIREPMSRGRYGEGWRRAYDDPGRWQDSPWRRAYGRASLDRYPDDLNAWADQPESAWRRWRRSERWERPEVYSDEGIEGYFDDIDEGDPDDFPAFEDPYPGWDEPTDGEVYEAVRQSLASDGFLDAGKIRVEVKDRVVTLRGEVADYMEARYAWDDAWDAPGVRGVISKLTVAHPAPREGSVTGDATDTVAETSPEAPRAADRDKTDPE